jgi:hypothetical protein
VTGAVQHTPLPLDPRDVTVVAAMGVEARPFKRLTPRLRLVRAGIGLATLDRRLLTTPVVLSVGLSGGLPEEVAGGTVVIPAQVAREDGVLLACDPAWSAALEAASRRLGYPTSTAPLLAARAMRYAPMSHTLSSGVPVTYVPEVTRRT